MQQLFLTPTYVSQLIIMTIIFTSCQHPTLFQHTEADNFPVYILTNTSYHPLEVFALEEGMMKLYYRMIPISEANLYNPFFPENEPKEVPQFFIGKTELMRVDQWNYESVIQQIMEDRPTLVQQLGRQGFRFENLKQMVAYYNKTKG